MSVVVHKAICKKGFRHLCHVELVFILKGSEKMRKFFKFIFILVILLAVVGYGLYYYGTNVASDKIMDKVTTELENSGQMDEIKTYVESDPQLKQFVEEAKAADPETLPFTTKGEATRVLIKKVGGSELRDIQTQAQEGTISKEEVIQTLQDKLTEEELTALKVIAYKEIYNK